MQVSRDRYRSVIPVWTLQLCGVLDLYGTSSGGINTTAQSHLHRSLVIMILVGLRSPLRCRCHRFQLHVLRLLR
jgi:hypothetical protein